MEKRYRETFGEIHAPERLRAAVLGLPAEAERPASSRRRSRRTMTAAAVLAALAVTACAAAVCRVEILPVEGEKWDPDAEVSFQVSGDVRRMELSEFSQAVRDEVRERIEEGGWGREHRFDTWAEAGEYLGVELSGPADMMVDVSLVVKEGRFIEVRLRGDVDGEDYGVEEGTSLWLDASLYTEDWAGPLGDQYYIHDAEGDPESELTETEYPLPGGESARIVTITDRFGGSVYGFLARDNVLYTAYSLYLTGRQELAEELVRALLADL